MWLDLLTTADLVSAMEDKNTERVDIVEKLLKGNLKKPLNRSRELEQSYRSVNLFYNNTAASKLKNVAIMNASTASSLIFPELTARSTSEVTFP